MFWRSRTARRRKLRLRAGQDAVDDVALQRDHADGALAQREGWPRRSRRQDALEAFAGFGQLGRQQRLPAMHFRADVGGYQSDDAFAIRFGQFHAQRHAARGQPIYPKGAIGVEHDFHHVGSSSAAGDQRPHRRAQHLDAAVQRAAWTSVHGSAEAALMTHAPALAQRRRVLHPHRVGVQFVHHVAHQAAAAQQVAAQLFNELLEACFALGARRVLVGLGNRRADRQVVADEQRQRFDLDVLVALQALGLARQAIEPLGDGRLALVGLHRATATMRAPPRRWTTWTRLSWRPARPGAWRARAG
jgi:hypothetical protein